MRVLRKSPIQPKIDQILSKLDELQRDVERVEVEITAIREAFTELVNVVREAGHMAMAIELASRLRGIPPEKARQLVDLNLGGTTDE